MEMVFSPPIGNTDYILPFVITDEQKYTPVLKVLFNTLVFSEGIKGMTSPVYLKT
jgi:hypothetical protein